MAQVTTSVSLPTSYTETQYFWNGAISTNTFNAGNMTWTETRPERVRTRKPTGWLYPKPYSLQMNRKRVVDGFARSRDTNVPNKHVLRVYSGRLGSLVDGGFGVALPAADSNLQRQSIIKALTGLKDQRVNLGVALAEAQRTADFVGSTANTIALSARDFMRGRLRRSFQRLGAGDYRNYPKGWLGWQYAATPLMSDVYGACEELDKRRDPFEWVITSKARARRTYRQSTELNLQPTIYPGSVLVDDLTVSYFTRLDYYPANNFLSKLSSVGVTNPLEIVWELVPFSFVFDWFVPVGEWLSTMDATLGFKFLSGSTTEYRNAVRKVKPGNAKMTSKYISEGYSFSGSARALSVIRTPHATSPLVAAPRVKNPISLTHMANGLSLLATVFGKR
jgi:hypothetical protein